MKLDSPQVKAGIKKHGSVEAYREFMRNNQRKSRENYDGKGGFKGMDVDRVKEISKLGVIAREKNRAEKQDTTKDNNQVTIKK